MTLTLPTVGPDGSPREDLLAAHQAAQRAVQAALDALLETVPLPCDYPPLHDGDGDARHEQAQAEWRHRYLALVDVRNELEIVVDYLDRPATIVVDCLKP